MSTGNFITLALTVVALGLFLRRLSLLVRLAGLGRGSVRLDGPAARLRRAFVQGFGQTAVLRKFSGIGHLFIFWGFFFLAFGAVEGLLGGVLPGFSFAFLGPLYPFINTGQDILGLLVIAALLFSVFRRLVLRPARLEGPFRHTVDALVIAALILVLTAVSYGLNVLDPKTGWTPVADALRNLPPARLQAGADASLPLAGFAWAHNALFLFFLVYLLHSKHSHILFALPNLFLKDVRHPGLIERLDLDDPAAERFGAQAITDFNKKDLVELFACSECGRCQESCPAYRTGQDLSPKAVIQDLKTHLLEVGPNLLREPGPAVGPPLTAGIGGRDALWACTTCRACNEACPVQNAPMDKIIEMRRARVLMAGDLPPAARVALQNIENQANPWGFPQEERGRWAEGLGVRTLAEDPAVEYLFYVGCAGSYDQRYISVSKAVVRILRQAGVSFGILGREEMCTGDSARRIGNDYLAQQLADANVSTLNRYGVRKIVTACPHCFNTLKNEYPQHGGTYEVVHHSELIADLLRTGRLRPAHRAADDADGIAYHDSCYLARYNRLSSPPREVIAGLAGRQPVELRRNGRDGFCCGAGGGRMWLDQREGGAINLARAAEIIESGATTVATACPFCMTMLADGIKRHNPAEPIRVLDIAELVAPRDDLPREMVH